MRKILLTLLITLSVVACATRKPAPISDANRAKVEEKSIGADTSGAGGRSGVDGQGSQGNQGAGTNGAGSNGRNATGGANDGGDMGVDGRGAAGAGGAGGVLPPRDAAGMLAERSIFFEYDSFAVKDDYKPVIQAHAKFLVENSGARVYLQGHTDERGSREYNLALGQKRADAVRRIMTVLGVRDNQIESVSYGEEKPKSPGHEENALAQNRRADIVYQGE